jgi:hypothetical protein
MLDDDDRAVLIDFDAALPLGEDLSLKYGIHGFVPLLPPLAESTSAKTRPELGYDSTDSEHKASSASLQSWPARTGGPPRLSCSENGSYALAQLAIRLGGFHDDKAADAQKVAESQAEWREGPSHVDRARPQGQVVHQADIDLRSEWATRVTAVLCILHQARGYLLQSVLARPLPRRHLYPAPAAVLGPTRRRPLRWRRHQRPYLHRSRRTPRPAPLFRGQQPATHRPLVLAPHHRTTTATCCPPKPRGLSMSAWQTIS